MSELVRFDPLREMTSLREAMNRLFEREFFRPFEGWPSLRGEVQPLALDLYETEESLMVEASLPGINPEDVDITIKGNMLTIKGESKQEEEREEKDKRFYYHERRYGAFHRSVSLPVEVDTDAVEAVFEQGVLRLTMPKVETAKPKHIEVKVK